MEHQNDIYDIQNSIYRQTNYYARELERIIDKIKIDANSININFIHNININFSQNKEECKKLKQLLDFIQNLKFKDIYNDSQVILQSDVLKEKLRLKEINRHLKLTNNA